MMTKDELHRQLVKMGKTDVVGPPRDFVDSLDARLAAMASAQHDYAPLMPPPRPRPKRVLLAPAFAAIVLTIAAIMVSVDGGGPAYALSDPFNVQVQLTDGRVVDGTDGLRVNKGAIVTVGAGGSVRIGDRLYREGDVIAIGVRGPEVTDHIDLAPSTTRIEVPLTTLRLEELPATTAPVTRAPETTVPPRPAEPAPTTKVEPPETTRKPETTQPPATIAAVVSMELAAQRVGTSSQVSLSWSAVDGAKKYLVVRTVAVAGATPAEPVYPPVSPTKIVVQTTARAHTDVAEAVEGVLITAVRYRVVALDALAKVIGSSWFVQVDLPR